MLLGLGAFLAVSVLLILGWWQLWQAWQKMGYSRTGGETAPDQSNKTQSNQ